MKLAMLCGLAVLRAAFIASIATALARPVVATLSSRYPRLAWTLLLIPLLTPALLVGYAYDNFALSLTQHRGLQESLYLLLMVLRLAPVAVLVLYLAPPPAMTSSAMHCQRLLHAGLMERFTLWLRGRAERYVAAFAVVFLLAYGDFEFATLLKIPSWTVWLFDAQTSGLKLSETLQHARLPLLCQVLVLMAAAAALARWRHAQWQLADEPVRATRWAWAGLVAMFVLVSLWPAALVARWSWGGWGTLMENPRLLREIRPSLFYGLSGAVLAYALARLILRRPRISAIVAAAFPGLLGSLTLGLIVLALFQWLPLRPWYDTALPLLLAVTLLLLPAALVLVLMMRALGRRSTDHLAEMLADSGDRTHRRAAVMLKWETHVRRQWWVVFLLFYWGYFDLSASTLLAPSGMTTVPVRLYNLTHYGRTAALSAQMCAAVGAAVMILLIGAIARRVIGRIVSG